MADIITFWSEKSQFDTLEKVIQYTDILKRDLQRLEGKISTNVIQSVADSVLTHYSACDENRIIVVFYDEGMKDCLLLITEDGIEYHQENVIRTNSMHNHKEISFVKNQIKKHQSMEREKALPKILVRLCKEDWEAEVYEKKTIFEIFFRRRKDSFIRIVRSAFNHDKFKEIFLYDENYVITPEAIWQFHYDKFFIYSTAATYERVVSLKKELDARVENQSKENRI